MVFYNLSNTFPVFPALEKMMIKFSVKISRLFDIILLIWSICFFRILYDNYDYIYSKFCPRKCKNNINLSTVICVNSNMAMLRVINH